MADKTVEVSTVSQHTVVSASTTTTTTLHGADAGNAQCTCDVNYLRSVQGITKMAEILLSLVAFIVMVSSQGRNGGLNFFLFVAIAATVVSSVTFLLLCTHLHLKVALPWNLVFAAVYVFMVILYFIAFIFAAADAVWASQGAAATLGFIALVAYIFSLFFALQDWRLNRQMSQQSEGVAGTYTGRVEEPPGYDAAY